MATFTYTFTVNAPVEKVSAFHGSTKILKTLTPPPLFVQIHEFGELKEGMVAKFTIWAGPIPLRWTAEHVDVSARGFTDRQVSGPLKSWAHTHTFVEETPTTTRVNEHIEYEHPNGIQGIFTRLMFGKPGLIGLFTYRKLITRWHTRGTNT